MRLAQKLRDIVAFLASLIDESDRGLVLASAAYLDAQLGELIEKFIIDRSLVSKEIRRRLYNDTGPFSSFSQRIDISYLLGLIPGEIHKALHTIRDIRNDCAHQHQASSLTAQSFADRCKNLLPLHSEPGELAPRAILVGAVEALAIFIHSKIEQTWHLPAESTSLQKAFLAARISVITMFDEYASLLPVALPSGEMRPISPEEKAFAENLARLSKRSSPKQT